MSIKDEALLSWVADIDWQTQRWWGAWLPNDLGLIGALQLSPSRQSGQWELAMTVSAPIRRRGVGAVLLSTAVEQTPEVECLVCHHGHIAVIAMTKKLGYKLTMPSKLLHLQVRNELGVMRMTHSH
ncbi:GNAT family N-acetyltransferase [Limnohabitans sp. T6-5]|uniref:GNAT family N-acetyltransferase n=1 Tax=Limnohabitans sp. T6-5 TaxID=1100724 RepID=UPI0035110084